MMAFKYTLKKVYSNTSRFSTKRFSTLQNAEFEKQRAEFEKLKMELLNQTEEEKIDLKETPRRISEINKMEVMMQCDRTMIDFEKEIKSIRKHEELYARPRLGQIINSIYIPKYKVKGFINSMYAGETQENYNNYSQYNNKNTLFLDKNRSKDEFILGIETSFDESAASLVTSYGEIKANHQISQWEQWQEQDGINPPVGEEKHIQNLPIAVDEALKQQEIKKGDKRLKAIAVTVGPGQQNSLNVGIRMAQKLGEEYNVPVIPVNHLEGHTMTTRFNQINQQGGEIPLLQFPYLSVLVTGKHTEIVLTRGIGLHSIVGMTIDCGVGECFDKAYLNFKKYKKVLTDDDQIQAFVQKYNQESKDKISDDYFDFLKSDIEQQRGGFIEKLAKYGDPSELELPIGFRNQNNCDMTFTGLKTAIVSAFHVRPDEKGVPFFERDLKDLNFQQLLNFAASIQFSLINQVKSKTQIGLDWCKLKEIPITALNLCGGVSCNNEFQRIMTELSKSSYNLPTVVGQKEYCCDNAAMIAWMGWELINAEQDVDIRGKFVNGLKNIPLGSYVEGQIHITTNFSKFLTRKQVTQQEMYQSRYNTRFNRKNDIN